MAPLNALCSGFGKAGSQFQAQHPSRCALASRPLPPEKADCSYASGDGADEGKVATNSLLDKGLFPVVKRIFMLPLSGPVSGRENDSARIRASQANTSPNLGAALYTKKRQEWNAWTDLPEFWA